MTATESTALAVRGISLAEIGRRIDLNKTAGWGLEKGTKEQLNNLALYCQKHGLLPGEEVTLYEGKIWKTIDGHVTLMRRQPEYRGYSQRPLSKSEKEDWGWDGDDIVVETTIRTATLGEIKAHGRVSAAEREGRPVQGTRLNPVARHHAVEMAQKRSLARAQRFAFGAESYVDDVEAEDTARVVIQERNDPARVAAGAAAYDRIIGSNYDDDHASAQDPSSLERSTPAAELTTPPTVTAERAELLAENDRIGMEAATLGVRGLRALKALESDSLPQIAAKNAELRERVASRTALPDDQDGVDDRQETF